MKIEVLKVGKASNPNSVAGMIAALIKENDGKVKPELHCVGAGALNQAVKAIAIARGFLSPMGYEIRCIPCFISVSIEGEDERTGIKFVVETI